MRRPGDLLRGARLRSRGTRECARTAGSLVGDIEDFDRNAKKRALVVEAQHVIHGETEAGDWGEEFEGVVRAMEVVVVEEVMET